MPEIGVKLTGDNTEYRSMLDSSVQLSDTFAGKVASKVGDKLFGLRDISNVVATSLGLNLEKLAGKLENFFGIGEEVQRKWNEAARLGDEITKVNLENLRAMMSEEQRYQSAVADRDSLLKKIAESSATIAFFSKQEAEYGATSVVAADARKKIADETVKLKQLELDLAREGRGIIDYERKQAEETAKYFSEQTKLRFAANEAQRKAQLENMSAQERQRAIMDDIANIEGLLNAGLSSEAEAQRFKNALIDRQLLLTKTQGDVAKDNASAREKADTAALRSAQALSALEEKKAKLQFDALSDQQKIAVLQEQESNYADAIAKLKAAQLDSTQLQVGLLETQAQLAGLLKNTTEQQVTVEGQVTTELKAQNVERARAAKIPVRAPGGPPPPAPPTSPTEPVTAAPKTVSQLDLPPGTSVTLRGPSDSVDYSNSSTAELIGLRDRLNSRLSDVDPVTMGLVGDVGLNQDYAKWVAANAIKATLARIESELGLRSDVQSYAKRFGELATVAQFGDSVSSRGLRDISEAQDRTVASIERIARGLAAVGLMR